jgi:arsenate reductase (thioredoxin)
MLSGMTKEGPPVKLVSSNAPLNVLFLCIGNSARSIMGGCILNRLGAGKFRSFSAGSQPRGTINPPTLAVCASRTSMSRSFARSPGTSSSPGAAPKLDFVVTVCDDAAKEVCPIWPASP